MTILTDYSFIHLVVFKNHFTSTSVTDITDYKQDLFAYIIIKRYTPKKFYSVIIDTGAFKKSTIDYKQYFAYRTTTNNNMDINIMQTGAVNV